MKNNRYILLTLVILALAAFPETAFATTTGVHTITGAFKAASSGWYTAIKPVATEIFGALFGIELVWMAVQWLITGKDVHEIFTSFIKKLLSIGFFFLILLNGHMLSWDVIQAFQATGVAAAGAPHTGMGWILDTGLKIFDACLKGPKSSTGGTDWLGLPTAKATISAVVGALVGIVVGLIAILALIYMALEYLAVQIEALLVTSLGVILLGFGGSKFTASYVEGYIKYAVSVGIRFFVLVVWVAFIEDKAPGIISNLIAGVEHKSGGTIASIMAAYGDVLIFVLLIAWLTKKLPSIASSVLTGSSSLSGGELMSGAAKGAALATAAVATGGMAVAGLAGAAAAGTAAGGMGAATGAAGSAGAGSLGAASGASGAGASTGMAAPKAASGGASSGGSSAGVPAPKAVGTSTPAKVSGGQPSGQASRPQASGQTSAPRQTNTDKSEDRQAAVGQDVESGAVAATSASGGSGTKSDGVDHRPSASNDAPQGISGGPGKTVKAPTPIAGGSTPAGGNTGAASTPVSQGSGSAPPPAARGSSNDQSPSPKKPSFMDTAKQHEAAMNKVHETLLPGEASTDGVSAPGLNVKHLSD